MTGKAIVTLANWPLSKDSMSLSLKFIPKDGRNRLTFIIWRDFLQKPKSILSKRTKSLATSWLPISLFSFLKISFSSLPEIWGTFRDRIGPRKTGLRILKTCFHMETNSSMKLNTLCTFCRLSPYLHNKKFSKSKITVFLFPNNSSCVKTKLFSNTCSSNFTKCLLAQ